MKVDVVALTYRRWNIFTHTMLDQMVRTSSRKHDVEQKMVIGNSVVHQSRNKSLQMLRKNSDAYLFIDDDMLPSPVVLDRLIETMEKYDLPAVSALCTGRVIPLRYSLFQYDRQRDMFHIASYVNEEPALIGHGELAGDYGTGLACFLVRHDALTQAMSDYFNAGDWIRDTGSLALALQANPDAVTNYAALLGRARRQRWNQGMWNDFFKLSPQTGFYEPFKARQEAWDEIASGSGDKPPMPLDLTGVEAFQMTESISEDLSFCRRLLQLGIPVAIDTGIRVAHLGAFAYGPYCIDAQLDSDVQFSSGSPKGYNADVLKVLSGEPDDVSGVHFQTLEGGEDVPDNE